jgi:hypothetical protein
MQQGWQQLERVDRSRPDIAEAREYRGLVLQPALDHEHDEVCRELWFVIHGATGNTVAVVAAGTNRAVQIASELAGCGTPGATCRRRRTAPLLGRAR